MGEKDKSKGVGGATETNWEIKVLADAVSCFHLRWNGKVWVCMRAKTGGYPVKEGPCQVISGVGRWVKSRQAMEKDQTSFDITGSESTKEV